MITMTFAINHDNFDGHREVTCMSCHRGASRPVAIPVIAAGEPEPEPSVPQAAVLPAASAVLDKYVQALGGAEAMAKVGSRTQKGKLSGFGPEPVPVDVSTKAPDKRITTVHGQRGDNVTAFDGKSGWLGSTGRPPRDMSAVENEAARLDAALFFPSDLKRLFKEFLVAPPGTIDGKDVVHLIAKNDGKPPAELWFDAQSGLVVRLVRYAETPLGRNPTQLDFADYRDAGGVKIPFRWTVARPSGRFTIQLDTSEQNVPIDDKTFEKPSQGPPS
jgi:outer membrane lipoprotein-sorting protein